MEAVILYSTNDYKFFKQCIGNLTLLNIKCHIVTYTHMWNGTPENEELLKSSFELFKNTDLVNFYKIEWTEGKHPWYWEALGRYEATKLINSEYVLYIDIDEIVDIPKFREFLDKADYKKFDTMKLANSWYWREPIYKATSCEYNTVLTKSSLAKQLHFQDGGREHYFRCSSNQGYSNTNEPFIDHYSWVRTKEEMLNKVKNWGHTNDTNWVDLVEEEFSRPFNGTDFVHGYSYHIVESKLAMK